MDKTFFAVTAAFSWALVAISSATPASAYAVRQSYDSGNGYATCGSSYWAGGFTDCMNTQFNYTQTMRFITTSCSQGNPCNISGGAYVDFIYGTGRKTVGQAYSCGTYSVVFMGSCSC